MATVVFNSSFNSLIVLTTAAWSSYEPWEKFILHTFKPASIISLKTSLEDEEGPEDEMEDEAEGEEAPMKKGGMAPSFLIAIEKGMGPKKK